MQTKAALDYETKSVYMVTVTVSDGTLTDTIIVTINVTDLEEVGESIVQQPEQSPPYARDRAKEFDTLQAAGNERPHGIWSDGTTLWVADAADAKIYAYRMPSQPAAKAQALIGLPDEPQLQQNAPNPFNSQTVLSYFLPKSGPVRLELFSVTGQRVAVLRQGPQQAGYHRLHWNAQDGEGRPLASGIYFYRLETADGILTRKLTLLR